MKQKVFTIQNQELGAVTVKRDRRAKYFRIRPTALGYQITVPYHATKKQIEKVLLENSEKIKGKKWDLNKATLITEEQPLKTSIFDVVVKKSKRENFYSQLFEDKLKIEYPENRNIEEEEIQRGFWRIIEHFFIQKAKIILPSMTEKLAREWDFQYNLVKIQRSKTRWGSCNSKGNINLSCYLMLVPQHLQEYVVLHELCHTIEMNHSAKFWNLMNKVTDNRSDLLKRELKKYSIPKL